MQREYEAQYQYEEAHQRRMREQEAREAEVVTDKAPMEFSPLLEAVLAQGTTTERTAWDEVDETSVAQPLCFVCLDPRCTMPNQIWDGTKKAYVKVPR